MAGMAEQQKQALCPRLIDYLAIVGAKTNMVPRAGGPNSQPPVQVSSRNRFFQLFICVDDINCLEKILRAFSAYHEFFIGVHCFKLCQESG